MGTIKNIKTYGFGVVAQGFYDYLVSNNEEERLHTVIIKNSTKIRKKIKAIIETTNPNTIKDKNTDVIVELISSSEEAYGIVAENLEIGKKVISANKKLIAENLPDLIQKEKSNDGTLLYEGAVCGSIPIIRILNDLYANDPVNEVKGIFNGSSNYILSQLFSKDISYEEALNQAQVLGFAESDPTSDVGGFDALYKLIIITTHAFGIIFKPHELLNIGIENISKADIVFAKKHQLKIKLIAKVALQGENLSVTVLPTFINSESDLYNVENEYNAVAIDSNSIGQQFYKGKGAGSMPTGAVVYSDLKAIDTDYQYSYKKIGQKNYQLNNDEKITVLLNAKDAYSIASLDFDVNRLFPINLLGNQFIAKISINELTSNLPNIKKYGISIIAIEDESLIKLLTHTSASAEVLN